MICMHIYCICYNTFEKSLHLIYIYTLKIMAGIDYVAFIFPNHFHRRKVEEAQQKSEDKNLRRKNSREQQEENITRMTTSLSEATAIQEKFGRIVQVLTSPLRPEKKNGVTWVEFFAEIVGSPFEPAEVPAIFQQEAAEELSFQQVIIRICSHLEFWQKRAKILTGALDREKTKHAKGIKWNAKITETKKRKVFEAFRQEEPEVKQQCEKKKSLDYILVIHGYSVPR